VRTHTPGLDIPRRVLPIEIITMNITTWEIPDSPPRRPAGNTPIVLAVGVFDGVHQGHQELLRRVVHYAQEIPAAVPAVLTFDPNPAAVIRPVLFPGSLMTFPERMARIGAFGIQEAVVVSFSPAFAAMPGPVFLEYMDILFPDLRRIVVGYNFHLGHDRDVSAEDLKERMSRPGVRVDIVPALKDNEHSISSSRIRRAITDGDLTTAARLLGRPYGISVAAGGDQLSSGVSQLLPPPGCYQCTVSGEDQSREGMMEITDDGRLRWEPRITRTQHVIPRSKVDVCYS
jgi:riboflavin kinase / FMN adenylyltransferase